MGRFVWRFAVFHVHLWARNDCNGGIQEERRRSFINALSDSFYDAEDNHAFTELIEEYFGESGDETEANTDNEEGMQCCFLTKS